MSRYSVTLVLLTFLAPVQSLAVSCSSQAQMKEGDRSALVQAARMLASDIQSGNTAAVRARTIPKVEAQFNPIANTIQQVAPLLKGAVLTIDALYGLDASDLRSAEPETEFFCGMPNSPLHVEITIPQLPPGRYSLAIVHATGVRQPQQMAFLLQMDSGWQLAGFFVRPLTLAGHDSVWYWSKAREFAEKNEKWNAGFYYSTAIYLAVPAGFLSSTNLEKLHNEASQVKAEGLPGPQPVVLTYHGQSFSITDMHVDGSLGGLDLVIDYTTADASDPVATRERNLEVMKAVLNQHPELRNGFHGLWVFANAPSQHPFGNELPMDQIR